MGADERVAPHAEAIRAALTATGITYEIHYEDDGGKDWNIVIAAGRRFPLAAGGSGSEYRLSLCSDSDEWLWGYVGWGRHRLFGPWPCPDLPAGASPAEVAAHVVDGLRSHQHPDDCEGCG